MKTFFTAFFTSLIVSAGVSYGIFWYLIESQWVEVPGITGKTLQEAQIVLEKKELKLTVGEKEYNANVPEGSVIAQEPGPWSEVKKGTVIRVTVSKGVQKVSKIKIPRLRGLTLSQARVKLRDFGLIPGEIQYTRAEVNANCIVSSSPQADEYVNKGTYVDLIVSEGIALVTVPKLFGKTLGEAREVLKNAGLKLGEVYYTSNEDYRFDIIIQQNPKQSENVKPGISVSVTINREEE